MYLGAETPVTVLAYETSNATTEHYGACKASFFVASSCNYRINATKHVDSRKRSHGDCRWNFVEWLAAAALRSLDSK